MRARRENRIARAVAGNTFVLRVRHLALTIGFHCFCSSRRVARSTARGRLLTRKRGPRAIQPRGFSHARREALLREVSVALHVCVCGASHARTSDAGERLAAAARRRGPIADAGVTGRDVRSSENAPTRRVRQWTDGSRRHGVQPAASSVRPAAASSVRRAAAASSVRRAARRPRSPDEGWRETHRSRRV